MKTKILAWLFCRYIVRVSSPDLPAPAVHYARDWQDALAWARCYASTDRVLISRIGFFRNYSVAARFAA